MAPKPFRFPRPSLEDMRPLIESLYGPNGPDAQNDPSALLIPQTIEQLYADVDFMRGARFAIAPGENETACEGGLVTVDNRIAFQFSFMGRGLSVSLATLENTEKSMIFLKTTWNVVTGKGKAGKEQARAHGLGSRTGKERAPPLPDTIYMPDDDDEPSAYVPTLGRIKSGEHTDMYDGRNLRVSVRHKGYQPLSMTPNALSVLEVIYHTVEASRDLCKLGLIHGDVSMFTVLHDTHDPANPVWSHPLGFRGSSVGILVHFDLSMAHRFR